MPGRENVHIRWRRITAPALLALVSLALAASLRADTAPVIRLSEVNAAPLTGAGPGAPVEQAGLAPDGSKGDPLDRSRPCPGAYHYLVPEPGGPCHGCTVRVGERFTLDLMLHPASYYVTAQLAYLTFTHELMQNVDYKLLTCAVTNTVRPDLAVFDAVLWNEVCNGPNPCVFRGAQANSGSLAFASGALLQWPPETDFRLAQVTFCATATGRAVIQWEHYCPGPRNCETQIISIEGDVVNEPVCYGDYAIDIIEPLAQSPPP